MKPLLTRAYDALRSRRLAAALLIALAAWSALATIVPQRDGPAASRDGVVPALASAVGLDRAFSSPVFVLLAALLSASTAACSLERTRAALKLWRRVSLPKGGGTARASQFDAVLRLDGAGEPATRQVSEALVRIGLRVRASTDDAVYATSSRIGLAGSPVFHWLLATLIVLIAAGQLTRSEGLMGIPVGSARVDRAESYGVVDRGPLHSRFSLLTIAVPSIALSHVVDGIERGPAPYVELRDGPYLLKAGHVYPNHPLRYKSLTIHANAHGLAVPVIAAEGSRTDVLLDFDEEAGVARSAAALEADGPAGATSIVLEVPLERYGGRVVTAVPRVPSIVWRSKGPSGEASGSVRPGDSFEPLPGMPLKVGEVGYYARLSVVDDWSVYPMYAVFALATLALALAVFAPYREALAVLEQTPSGTVVRVRARHSRRDPGFGIRVRDRLKQVLAGDVERDRRSSDDD